MGLVPPQDALFLLGETEQNPTHVTALQILRPRDEAADRGGHDDLAAHLYAVLTGPGELKSAFLRKPVRSWTTAGAYSWEPDADFDVTRHVRATTLPAPGRMRELLEHVGELHARPLERDRPLWTAEVVSGLDDGRVALVTKLHHAMFDGITLAKHMTTGLSHDPAARGAVGPWTRPPGRPRPAPDDGGVLGTVGDLARGLAGTAAGVVGGLPALGRALAELASGGLGLAFAAPHTRLNARLSQRRRFAGDAWPLARLAAVAERAGTTVNDVGLALCSGALRAYLDELGELPAASLVAMVPVSLRSPGDGGSDQGNSWGSVYCVLGTDLPDPADRLARVHASMTTGKATLRDADPTTVVALNVASMGLAALPTLRMLPQPPRPVVNLIISNVPAPKEPVYFDGAEVTDNYPVSMVSDGQALNITLVPYADRMAFGLTGCPEAVPHLQRLLTHLDTALVELEAAVAG